MRYFILVCFLFFYSCELYERTNPLDPSSSKYKDDGTNANFSILETNISSSNPRVISITLINDGIGFTRSPISGSLETLPRFNFTGPYYNTDRFRVGSYDNYSSQSQSIEVNPFDKIYASFRFTLPDSLNLPQIFKCVLSFQDSFKNHYELEFDLEIIK